jgi:hypothetical protein
VHAVQVIDPPLHVLQTRAEVAAAIYSLEKADFDVRKLSLIGKGLHFDEHHPIGFYAVGDRIKSWGADGAFWDGIWTMLLSPAVFFLPGLGVIAMAGPVTPVVIATLEGVVVIGGVTALGAALTLFGASSDQAKKYETAVKADNYVLVVHGDADDALKARSIFADTRELAAA